MDELRGKGKPDLRRCTDFHAVNGNPKLTS